MTIEVYVSPLWTYIALSIIAAYAVIMYLMLKSSNEFSQEQTEKISHEFAGTIKGSNGPVTTWLWIVYIGLIIWAIAYLIQHSPEFYNFPF